MHWSKLLRGAELYRGHDKWDKTYDPFLCLPEFAELTDASERLVTFINSWATRSPMKPIELRLALERSYGELEKLAGLRIETLPEGGDGLIADIVPGVFDGIARCGRRNESTGASKILHALLPNLFVMWDMRIAGGYGIQVRPTGINYAQTFLPRVTFEMDEAISSYIADKSCSREEAVERLVEMGDGRTLPRLLDQYNYVKFTLSDDELWRNGNSESAEEAHEHA